MIKKLYALIFALLLAGCSTGTVEYIPPAEPSTPIHQEDENMAENIALNHATGSYNSIFTPNLGVVANMYDNDETTAFGYSEFYQPPGPGIHGYFLISLDDSYHISSVSIRCYLYPVMSAAWSLSYWDGSAYETIASSTSGVTDTIEATINRVTDRVRLDFSVSSYSYDVRLYAFVREFRIYGGRADSGLRIKTPQGTVSLAEDTDGVSPLKVRDGSITRSLLLVPPSDAAASPLRIRHNGVTYAVAKL